MNGYALSALLAITAQALPLEPIPDRLVVLTFDDSSKSHFTVARPLLKKHRFGATFFVTEGFDFVTNKRDYMSWDEIAQLHEDGFEIGNHTIDHGPVNSKSPAELAQAIKAINERCREHGIPEPVSFAYPGNAFAVKHLPTLRGRASEVSNHMFSGSLGNFMSRDRTRSPITPAKPTRNRRFSHLGSPDLKGLGNSICSARRKPRISL